MSHRVFTRVNFPPNDATQSVRPSQQTQTMGSFRAIWIRDVFPSTSSCSRAEGRCSDEVRLGECVQSVGSLLLVLAPCVQWHSGLVRLALDLGLGRFLSLPRTLGLALSHNETPAASGGRSRPKMSIKTKSATDCASRLCQFDWLREVRRKFSGQSLSL